MSLIDRKPFVRIVWAVYDDANDGRVVAHFYKEADAIEYAWKRNTREAGYPTRFSVGRSHIVGGRAVP